MTRGALPRRGAIVGFGNVAVRAHLPAWQSHPQFAIEAVVDPDPERRAHARALLPRATIHDALEPLLAEGAVDFLDICTPPRDHADLILAAFAAGCDAFCEKPLVATVAEMRRIESGAHRAGRVVYSVDNWKHAPIWRLAADLVAGGAVGDVREIAISVLRPPGSGGGQTDWRRRPEIAGGGILLDHGWHNLYLLLSLVGRPPVAVCARMTFASGAPVEEVVDLRVRFEDAEARVHLTWRATRRENHATIRGTGGTIALNDDHLLVGGRDGTEQRHDLGEALSASSHHAAWMVPVVDAFGRELDGGAARGRNLEEAGWCARLVANAYASAQADGAWIAAADAPPMPSRRPGRGRLMRAPVEQAPSSSHLEQPCPSRTC